MTPPTQFVICAVMEIRMFQKSQVQNDPFRECPAGGHAPLYKENIYK